MKAIGELLGDHPPPTFEQWYQAYPKGRRTRGAKVVAKWDAMTAEQKSACFLGTLKHAEHNPQWRDGQYVPMMATFLNQERWDFEITITRQEDATERAQVGDNADKVWAAMIEMYGDQFINKHGAKPSVLWQKFLKPLSEKRIRRGLRATLDNDRKFPPSLPAFIAYCAPTFGESHPNKALPRPDGDPVKADEAFAAIYADLGIK